MKKNIGTFIAATSVVVSSVAYASGSNHWGYTGHEGPEHWGELDSTYILCTSGKNQSPVNLTGFIEGDLKPIAFNYTASVSELLNNGHTVQANIAAGNTITVADHTYDLKQIHFHTPSENLVEGKSFPLEGHLVHADKDGNLAVVAVMFEVGGENRALAKLWQHMPEQAGEKKMFNAKLDAGEILPKNRDYYRFNGSLTTPPCSEGVMWLVMKEPVSVSKAQVDHFAHVMHHPNNRPVQPAFARPIIR